uniref:Uncharacterized protein n=1 Tax=uncultured marine virus TaxID=186617 RepID=A0A0F7L6R4_9VIRU|nr:hypothetical protein [uncultured marine virus]
MRSHLSSRGSWLPLMLCWWQMIGRVRKVTTSLRWLVAFLRLTKRMVSLPTLIGS